MKLLLITLLLLSSATQADGIDDPNFYRNFDHNPCAYNLGVTQTGCENGRLRQDLPGQPRFLAPDFTAPYRLEPAQKPVPEPEQLTLLALGVAAWCAKRRFLN